MTGHTNLVSEDVSAAARVREPGPIVLRATGLTLTEGAEPIDFARRAGAIAGLAGLDGQGQNAFLRALGGLADRAGTDGVEMAARREGGGRAQWVRGGVRP